jgi:hypothetical protein
MIAKTPEESAELLRRRPINWDELGSSEKDLWEERHVRSMRKAADRQGRAGAL